MCICISYVSISNVPEACQESFFFYLRSASLMRRYPASFKLTISPLQSYSNPMMRYSRILSITWTIYAANHIHYLVAISRGPIGACSNGTQWHVNLLVIAYLVPRPTRTASNQNLRGHVRRCSSQKSCELTNFGPSSAEKNCPALFKKDWLPYIDTFANGSWLVM